jgi:hypothetical protein
VTSGYDIHSSPNQSGKQIQNEMGRACSKYGGEVYTGFWWGNLRKRGHLEDTGANGRITLRWVGGGGGGNGREKSGFGKGQVAGNFTRKCVNEISGSI